MPADRAILEFDHAQYRIDGGKNLTAIAIRGLDWQGDIFDDAMLDPVTNSLIIRPMCMYSNYWSVNTGIAAKPTIGSGMEVKTSAKWKTVDAINAGFSTHAQCDAASGEYIRTDAVLGLNQGIFVSLHLASAGDGGKFEMGWSNSTTPTAEGASIGIKLFSDASIEVWKDGSYVSSGRLTGTLDKNHLLNIVFLPGRRRELLIFSTQGSGFRVIFDDIDEDETAPEITPAEKFFGIAPDGGNMQILLHPLAFQTSGYIVSRTFKLVRPPATGMELQAWSGIGLLDGDILIHGDTAFAGTTGISAATLKTGDGVTAFTPDGSETECRIRVDMTGDGDYTPFIYGGLALYKPQFATTDDSETFDATPYINKEQQIVLTVPDEGSEATLAATLMDPDTVQEEVPQLKVQVFRPGNLRLGELQIFDGYMRRPRAGDGIVAEVRRMQFELVALEGLLQMYRFPFRVPFDGWPLCEPEGLSAIGFVLSLVIDPARLRLSSLAYTLGQIPDPDGTSWNITAEAGETALEVLEKLHRYAADCVYGSHPGPDGPEFWFKTPADLPQEPVITLYRTPEDALLAYPDLTDEEAMDLCFDEWWEEPLEIEANDVSALGVDPRSRDFVSAYAVDEGSQDATLPPSMRPDNWAGFPLMLGMSADTIRSLRDAGAVVTGVFPLGTEAKKICDWAANTLLIYEDTETGVWLPVWRMDLVNLDTKGERRVSSLTARFMVEEEAEDGIQVRRVNYTGGTIIGRGGRSVAEVQAIQRMRLAQRGVRQMNPLNGFAFRSSSNKVSKVTP